MQAGDIRATAGVHPDAIRSVERVYGLWDAALGAKDVDAAAALYAEDTRLESPLVRRQGAGRRSVSSLKCGVGACPAEQPAGCCRQQQGDWHTDSGGDEQSKRHQRYRRLQFRHRLRQAECGDGCQQRCSEQWDAGSYRPQRRGAQHVRVRPQHVWGDKHLCAEPHQHRL